MVKYILFFLFCIPSLAFTDIPGELNTSAGRIKIVKLAAGLNHPWGMAFLPGGDLLFTERPGNLRILDKTGKVSDPIPGVPKVYAKGQGGLLDVALHPEFKNNRLVYLSFAEAEGELASTALGFGIFEDGQIKNFRVIFSQKPKVDGPNHFGGRIVFKNKAELFLTTGERFKFTPSQDLKSELGKIIHIQNPAVLPAASEIWTYGHRNIQAAAIDKESGKLWIAEMGPKGGDELNLIVKGKNYGWPLVSHGTHYDGKPIPHPDTRPDLEDAIKTWSPSIAPSGMTFYSGKMFAAWKGSALIGGLVSESLFRVPISENKAGPDEVLKLGERIRDVEEAPDGSIYLLTDSSDGKILKLESGTNLQH